MSELLNGSRNELSPTNGHWVLFSRKTTRDVPARPHPKSSVVVATSSVALALLSGCQAVGTIFKAGFWVGIIAVVAVLGLIIFGVTKLRT